MTAFSLLILVSSVSGDAGTWPGFLGAGAERPTAESLPLAWSPDKGIAWKAALPGHGQSSPVVWGGKVFVTAVEGEMKDKCHVLAFDLATGKELWKQSFDSSDKVKNSLYVSRAAPTPAADERGVYAFFESGDVLALSHDGQPLWQRSLAADYGQFKNKFGLSASPVQSEEAIVILVDDEGPSYLLALSKTDGKTLWKTDRTSRLSWSSPALVSAGKSRQVVCSSAGSVDGYDLESGNLLWTYGEVGGNTAATPLPFADGKFLIGASAGREGENAEGAKKSNMAMTIDLANGKLIARVLWRNEQATTSFGSPVVYAGHAYYLNRSGVLYCLDADTGEAKYTQRLKQSCWATPLGVGNRVYFFGKDGATTVLAAGPKFEILAENQLWDPAAIKPDPAKGAGEDTEEKRRAAAMFSGPVQYGVAAVEGSLLVRTGEVLYCLRK